MLVSVRPICRGWLRFVAGPSPRPCTRSPTFRFGSGRSPEGLASAAFGRQPCFAKSVAHGISGGVRRCVRLLGLAPSRRAVAPGACAARRARRCVAGYRSLLRISSLARNRRTASSRLLSLDTRRLSPLLSQFCSCSRPSVLLKNQATAVRLRLPPFHFSTLPSKRGASPRARFDKAR